MSLGGVAGFVTDMNATSLLAGYNRNVRLFFCNSMVAATPSNFRTFANKRKKKFHHIPAAAAAVEQFTISVVLGKARCCSLSLVFAPCLCLLPFTLCFFQVCAVMCCFCKSSWLPKSICHLAKFHRYWWFPSLPTITVCFGGDFELES